MAAFYSVVTIGLYALSGQPPFPELGVSLGETLVGYGVGALAAGITYGVIKPLARTAVGSIFVGILVVAAALSPLGFLADDRASWIVVAVMTAIFGTIGGVTVARPRAIDREMDELDERFDRLMAGELTDEELAALEREYQADLERRQASRRSRLTS